MSEDARAPTAREHRERTLAETGTAGFPDRLVITVTEDPPEETLATLRDRPDTGADRPATRVLPPDVLRKLLTPRRLELIESVMGTPPDSISALADRLDRTYSSVHDDLDLLADHGIVVFDRAGRRARPTVPYERIEYEGVLTAPSDPETASA